MARTSLFAVLAAGLLVGVSAAGVAYAQNESEHDDYATRATHDASRGLRGCVPSDGDAERGSLRECVKDHLGSLVKRERGAHGDRDHAKPPFPPFHAKNGTVVGRFVSFTVDADANTVTDYTAKGGFASTVLFDAMTLEDADAWSATTRGPVYAAKENGSAWIAFNAPNAAFTLLARDGATVTLDVGDDLAVIEDVDEEGRSVIRITHGDDHSARLVLRGNGTLALDGDVVTATLDERGALVFLIDGYPRVAQWERHVMQRMLDGPHDARGE